MPKLDAALRRAVAEDRYLISVHANQRMGERKVSDLDVKHVVAAGDVIERKHDAKPFPKALFVAQVRGEPLYVASAYDGATAYIITVHWYDPSKWVDPSTRRKG